MRHTGGHGKPLGNVLLFPFPCRRTVARVTRFRMVQRKELRQNLTEARGYLEHWTRITTTIGQGEFDSPDYFPEYAVSMSLLADYARDPAMRTRGSMMMDFLLADFAADQLDGQYLGGFSRIYQPAVFKPLLSGASAFAYLFLETENRRKTPGCSSRRLATTACRISSTRLPRIARRPICTKNGSACATSSGSGTEKESPGIQANVCDRGLRPGSAAGRNSAAHPATYLGCTLH